MTTSNDNLRESVWSGSFFLYGVELKCHVLNTGERIIEADSMDELFSKLSEPGLALDSAEMDRFTRWQRGGPDA